MEKQEKKRRGPPKTGHGKLIGVRVRPALLATIDQYIERQPVPLTRPQAIRRIVEDYFHDRPINGRRKT